MDFIKLICIGLLGVVAYVLVRANSLKQDANSGNVEFSFKDYISKDYLSICLSVVAVLLWVFLFKETVTQYPKIEAYTRMSFAGVGFLGSYILQLIFGKAKNYIRKEIDAKTNELDEIKGKL